jgi:hypothetical protein
MYTAPPPSANEVTADTMLWPVFALTVNKVMIWLELNLIVMPSLGEAGIVIVPVANVVAGFITST